MHMKLPGRKLSTVAAVFVAWMSVWTGSALQNAQAAAASQWGAQPPARPAASSDNYLSHLSFDVGMLEPAFTSATQEYTLTGVPYASAVGISYTTNSTLIYDVSAFPCVGRNPQRCSLTASDVTTVTITIVAEDYSTRIYTVTVSRPDGVIADPLVAPVTKLSHGATAGHKCAVLGTGQVLCWGSNDHGQLGLGTTSLEQFAPLTVTGVTDAVDVAVGYDHTCVLRTGGGVQCWGGNDKGQLGDGTTTDRTTPVDVLNPNGGGPLTGATSLSVGAEFTCAAVNGAALCWGLDVGVSGWNGSENVVVTHSLPLTVTGVTDAVSVAAGRGFACVLTNAGKVLCWGENGGQLGNGTATSTPISVPMTMKNPAGTADLTGVMALRAGYEHTCVIVTTGQQLCAGDNEYYFQLGDGSATDQILPVTTTVTGTAAALANVVQSAPGDYHSCALISGGTVHCAAQNYHGVLGIGLAYPSAEAQRATTVTISAGGPPLTGVVEIAAGANSTCARTASAVYCWGDGTLGRLGSGVFDDMYSPQRTFIIPPPQSSDASLANLTLSPPAVLGGTWVSTTLRYTVNVPAGETAIMFALTPSVTSTLDIMGTSTAGGCDISYAQGEEGGSGGCTIDPSETTIVTLTVTAEDGTTTQDYVLVVRVSSGEEPHASELVIDIPGLTPAFVSTTLNYETEVPSGTNTLVVTPTLSAGATAVYTSTAGACTASATSGACPLFPTQSTTVTVGVTDGATTRSYTILATRASAPPPSYPWKLWLPIAPVTR